MHDSRNPHAHHLAHQQNKRKLSAAKLDDELAQSHHQLVAPPAVIAGPSNPPSYSYSKPQKPAPPPAPAPVPQLPQMPAFDIPLPPGFDASAPVAYPEARPNPPKKKKVKGEEPEPEEEKRLSLFKKQCPKNLLERVDRVMSQRFFCIERQRTSEITEKFKVLGSTGNVYEILISRTPSCSCPDGQKNGQCKHILFVLLKVLHVPRSSNLWYQKSLLTSEIRAIFALAPRDRVDTTTANVRHIFKLATGQIVPDPKDQANATAPTAKRLPAEGDSCPVCYEDFEEGEEKGLVFCLGVQGCGNGLHEQCFAQWAAKQNPVTCVLCRTKWTAPVKPPAPSQPTYSEGYLNLAGQVGLSGVRDTSTYYRGPQK
ncbi:zinc finger, RING-type protein [Pseudohyphozyma bogoriensis]|nr:zinc finger, RING-type protein [Pseudohyphozyma bogoriensis]